MRTPLFALLLGALLFAAHPVNAQTTTEALATELFNAGRDLMNEGRFVEACPKLEESARLDPKVGALAKLGECEEALGRAVRSRASWQKALNLALAENDDRLPQVQEQFTRIDAKVPKLRLFLKASPPPPDLTIRIDDLELGAASIGTPIPMEGGRHVVAVSASGKRSWSKAVELPASGSVVDLPIPMLEDLHALPSAPPPVAPAPGPEAKSPLPTLGLIAAGAGIVELGVGAVYGGLAKSKLDESNRLGCDGDRCPPIAATVREEARVAGDISTAMFITGGVLAAGGITLWLATRDGSTHAAPAVKATAAAGPSSGGLFLSGKFQ